MNKFHFRKKRMSSENPENPQSVHDFKVKDTFGNDVSLDKYSVKVLIIVNIASKCGLTNSNYKQLTELHEKYKDQGLFIYRFIIEEILLRVFIIF